ncbi:uncharacterized protein [Dermacentor albipictus]|uniref:uncharacterized protein isoform X2 n=1 Tax=Dermacentor albipictus TaxID=60249 RepID=UPI0031FC45A1
MSAARFLTLLFVTVLCGVQDAVCEDSSNRTNLEDVHAYSPYSARTSGHPLKHNLAETRPHVPQGCGDVITKETSPPVPTTTTRVLPYRTNITLHVYFYSADPPKDYLPYSHNRCIYKLLQSGPHMYPTSCKVRCRAGWRRTRLVRQRLPNFTKCLKLADHFAERSLDSKQCIVGFCLRGECRQTSRRVSCHVPGAGVTPSSNAEK